MPKMRAAAENRVNVVMSLRNRDRLKVIAGIHGIPFVDYLDQVAGDAIRKWEGSCGFSIDEMRKWVKGQQS